MSGFRNLALTFLVCTLLLNSSCAPTEDEVITADNVQREGSPGIFLDSAVGGVDYTTTSGLGGVTDSSGRFYYNPGDQVSFTIGGISLGSVTGAAKLTPVEVMGASGTADQKVINLSRLLQTLDADGDPSNGISINDSTKTTLAAKSVNFDVSVEAFDNATKSVTAAVGKTMVTATRAIKHLHSTLNDQGLSSKVASDADLQSVSSELDNFTTVAANFTVSENATALTEASGSSHTDTFTVVLASEPVGNVVFSVVPSDASEVSSSPSSLTFSPDNWSTAQTVTLTGTDDEISDGTISSAVTVGINESQTKDSEYDKLKSHSISATTSDDEGIPSVTLTAAIVSLVEDEETLTLTVNMSLASGVDTTVDFTTSGTAERDADYSITPDPLIIPSGSKQGTVTVKSINDEIDDDAETIIIGVGVGSISNSVGATNNIQDVTLTISDDDTAGFQLSKTTAAVTESGTKDTFTVVLDSKPTHDVIVTLTSDDTGEATVSPDNLTFTSENWKTAQTVTITGVADDQDDENATSTITVSVNSSDTNYVSSKLSDKEVEVTTSDGDTAGFKLSETTVTATEGGDNATFTVELTSKPTSAVTIGIAGSTEASVSPTSLSFDASDWKTPKTVTVTAVNDSVDDDQQTSTITVSVSSSSDSKYGSGIANQSVTATTKDDDTAGFALSKNTATVTEGGDSDNFTVVLNSEPTQDVVLTLTANDSTEVSISSSSTLTFTSSNWNTAQTVIIAAADENLDDDNITSTVTVAVSSTNDAKYDNITNQTVTVTTVDDDTTPLVTLTADNSSMSETGGTIILTVSMSTAATADTTIALYPSGTATLDADFTISNTTLTIPAGSTSDNITLTALTDQVDEDSEAIIIDISGVSGGNGAKESGNQQRVVNITDDDTAAFTPSKTTAAVTEGGTTDSLTVVLGTQPTADVVFSLTASDSTEATVSPATLTFSSTNWDTPQNVVITGKNDAVSDGSKSSTVTIAINTGSTNDEKYAALLNQSVSVTTSDDEAAPVITLATSASSLAENGGTATLTVTQSVATEESTTVTLSTASSGATLGSDFTISATTLTLAAGSTTGTATLTGVSDQIDDDNESIVVDVNTVTGGNGANESNTQQVTVTITDDDSANFTITQSNGSTTVTESTSSTDTFTVVLGSEPTGSVILNIVASDNTEATVAPSSLTFTSSNWSTTQTVTVKGVSDSVDDGDQNSTITLSVDIGNTLDPAYDALDNKTVTVTTSDGDSAGFTLSKTTAAVTEAGSTDSFTVVLTSKPTGDVVFSLSDNDSDDSEVNITSPSQLTFTSSNWNTAQTVTVQGLDDSMDDGDISTLITLAINQSNTADSIYDALNNQTVTVTTSDNDTAGISISCCSTDSVDGSSKTNAVSLAETGGSTSFTVVLQTQPSSSVILDITPMQTTEFSTASDNLTFTTGNWNTPQTVTINAVADDLDDGDKEGTVRVTPSSSNSDTNYAGLNYQPVWFKNIDDDTSGFTITESGGSTSVNENLTEDTFTVKLTAKPTNNVVFSVTSNDTSEATVSPASLTFTALNWDTAQTVTLTGVQDVIDDDNQTSTITVSINQSSTLDDNYDSVVSKNVSFTTIDDESAPLVTLAASSDSIAENGSGSVTLTATMTVASSSDTTITLSLSGTATQSTDYSLANGSIVISAGQTTGTDTITVVNDSIVEASQTIIVDISVSGSTAGESETQQVTVTITDDDSAAVIIEDVNVNEGSNAGLTLTLNNEVEGGFTIDATAYPINGSGTATGGTSDSGNTDFIEKTESITFSGSAGETKSFSVTTTTNGNENNNETFEVKMDNLVNTSASVTITDTATVTIINQ